jgi:RNA 2',3'-cyclic 3'-phosphodiesterase
LVCLALALADKVRAFVAVDVDDRIRRQVAHLEAAFRPVTTGAKWVEPALCHITLKFLGSVPGEQLPAITEAGWRVAAAVQPFELDFRGVGAFPRWRGARVLWMGLDGAAPLAALQAALEQELAPLGFEPQGRPFAPHLTLARFKQPPSHFIEEVARQFEHEHFGTVAVRALRLMRSDLHRDGPTYTLLDAWPLG